MSISIVTKYLGPTNHRGSRVSAQSGDYDSRLERFTRCPGASDRLVVGWDHALDGAENHRRAAMALAKRLGWSGTWYGGDAPGSAGWVFVRASAPAFTIEEAAR